MKILTADTLFFILIAQNAYTHLFSHDVCLVWCILYTNMYLNYKLLMHALFPRNEQYYEAIMAIWNQLYINIKSLISWQYCLKDINYINTLTVAMVRMPLRY